MIEKSSSTVKIPRVSEELDRRISRRPVDRDLVDQMRQDQRSSDRLNAWVQQISSDA